MSEVYYQIKDNCRNGLSKYMAKTVSLLSEINNPKILDIGCGTGVTTIWLAENYGGIITAIDTDESALKWLNAKISAKNLKNQINTINISFFDLNTEPCYFDIVLAEGFLNIIGFENGFVKVIDIIKEGGYFIIHDEFKDHWKKCDFIRNNYCDLIDTIFLDETVWWKDFYKQLEAQINTLNVKQREYLFPSELKEIQLYKKDRLPFRSIYYIVKKLLKKYT